MHLEPPISKSSDIIVSSSEEVGPSSGKSGSGSNSEALSVAQPESSSTLGCVVLLQIWVGISFCDCFLCGAKRSREKSQGRVCKEVQCVKLLGVPLVYCSCTGFLVAYVCRSIGYIC